MRGEERCRSSHKLFLSCESFVLFVSVLVRMWNAFTFCGENFYEIFQFFQILSFQIFQSSFQSLKLQKSLRDILKFHHMFSSTLFRKYFELYARSWVSVASTLVRILRSIFERELFLSLEQNCALSGVSYIFGAINTPTLIVEWKLAK